jgi:hypothetical protein
MVGVLEIKIHHGKFLIMKEFILLFIVAWIWAGYEIWRAPLIEETEDGKTIIKRPAKKLSDLWRKRS